MTARTVGQLRRLQEEREKRAALEVARANAVVLDAVAGVDRALAEQDAFRARRGAREQEIYAAMVDKPVRTVELELMHMELEALLRMEGVIEARVVAARELVQEAEAALAEERTRYLASRRRHDKWREVEQRGDRQAAVASERAQELELEDRSRPSSARLGDAA